MARDTFARLREPISHQRATELLRYDPDTGLIYWRTPNWRCKNPDGVAGSRAANGYMQVKVEGQNYLAHRMAWFLHHGEWPSQQIDHINGDRADNRLANLRDVPQSMNMQNVGGTGLRGVAACTDGSGKFEARIRATDRRQLLYLGRFDTADAAHAAYLTAKQKMHPGFVPRSG